MYLHFPAHLDFVTRLLCDDMEQNFVDSLSAKLDFMRKRGVTDPYELAQIEQDYITERQPKAQLLLDKCLETVPDWLAGHQCSDDEFEQAWALMGGVWNVVEFENIRRIVRVQYSYPQVLEVAKVLGRMADNEGPARVPLGMGGRQKVQHSTPSDIEGVGVGNDLSALLPLELAQMADSDMDSLFAYKFATRRLQTFSYRSHIMHPGHKLRLHRARQKGPMVVCLDTSSSMQGIPTEVAHSLVVKLLNLALKQDRDLLLIPFAVHAKPFDVRLNRTRLLDFFRQPAEGDTDAEAMLQLVFHTLCSRPEYGSADVLLVSDFQIPMPSAALLRQLRQMHEQGTRFYGLQIGGVAGGEWSSYFDRIWFLPYEMRMRPWFIQK